MVIARIRLAETKEPRVPRIGLSIEQAAEALSLSPRTISELIRKREIPFAKIGKRTILSVRELRRWLSAKSTIPAGSAQRERDTLKDNRGGG